MNSFTAICSTIELLRNPPSRTSYVKTTEGQEATEGYIFNF